MRRDPEIKAYIKLDSNGYAVPASLVLRKKQPKRGRWIVMDADQCCTSTTTTTTTTEAP